MKDKKVVVLIGMMGSGKSTVARELANWLGYHLSDIDAQIEYKTQSTISKIFQEKGEAHFRELERQELIKACQISPNVIATGGGAFMDLQNRSLLKETGIVFYLRASPEILYERVRYARSRPLLENTDSLTVLHDLLQKREPFYLEADYTIDVEKVTPAQTVRSILDVLSPQTPSH